MADSKELVTRDSGSSPEFIRELLPSAERTALLYHLSYLCLGGFPKLERLIRERAIETQLLFGSSEAVLLKCVGTSENLVKSLLPFLKVAVEKNKPQLALKFLDKAKEWISDIISDVNAIVERYQKHNIAVRDSTSDISAEKQETEMKQKKQTSEMEALQKIVKGLEENLRNINKKIEGSEKKIDEKHAEIQKFINKITSTNDEQTPAGTPTMGSKVSIFSMMVPFAESVIGYIWEMVKSSSDEKAIKAFNTALSSLTSAQQHLKEEEWKIQNKLMDNQLQLAKLKMENGQIPNVSHFDEVQACLSRIQQILVELQKFWEKVGSLLDTMKKETFAGEACIEELADMKEPFLESIDAAKEGWIKFGICCINANKIFSVQSSQAYTFLEISPSSLSTEEWQKEYESVKEKLEKITPNTIAITQ
ncbi:uncharacterized protein [Sinocyclocheilus grahami]|uniref:uncharacterized protein n=1 Tax=Sinocyclocheilus grahami TaxID=75366 RepID=UPI0007AD1756|nr:PREDICTED: uncharacterized protein LOC107578451 [Sinocyclocheilus grahami]